MFCVSGWLGLGQRATWVLLSLPSSASVIQDLSNKSTYELRGGSKFLKTCQHREQLQRVYGKYMWPVCQTRHLSPTQTSSDFPTREMTLKRQWNHLQYARFFIIMEPIFVSNIHLYTSHTYVRRYVYTYISTHMCVYTRSSQCHRHKRHYPTPLLLLI